MHIHKVINYSNNLSNNPMQGVLFKCDCQLKNAIIYSSAQKVTFLALLTTVTGS